MIGHAQHHHAVLANLHRLAVLALLEHVGAERRVDHRLLPANGATPARVKPRSVRTVSLELLRDAVELPVSAANVSSAPL